MNRCRLGLAACAGALAAAAVFAAETTATIHVDDMPIHDPFILRDDVARVYICYRGWAPGRAGGGEALAGRRAGVVAYVSRDLVHWEAPRMVFEIPEDFWADPTSAPWAPEVHAWNGRYYLLTTFNAWNETLEVKPGRPPITRRASQVLVADSPLGPFRPFANRPHTPDGMMTLDATLYVEDGQPWLVYCHEWVQIEHGTIEALRLTPDLSATVGEPIVLLDAAEHAWTARTLDYRGIWTGRVTDGPQFHRLGDGTLAMLWSSHSEDRLYAQAVAYSRSGRLAGPWEHPEQPLLADDRGHGMIFRDFDGRPLLAVHRHFRAPATRLQIWSVDDRGPQLRVGAQRLGAL